MREDPRKPCSWPQGMAKVFDGELQIWFYGIRVMMHSLRLREWIMCLLLGLPGILLPQSVGMGFHGTHFDLGWPLMGFPYLCILVFVAAIVVVLFDSRKRQGFQKSFAVVFAGVFVALLVFFFPYIRWQTQQFDEMVKIAQQERAKSIEVIKSHGQSR